MVTLEQVEELRQHTNISFEEAKAVLEETNGDILEAIIKLEKQNRIKQPQNGGYYSSKSMNKDLGKKYEMEVYDYENEQNSNTSFKDLIKKFFKWSLEIIKKGNKNSFVVKKADSNVITVPVTVLAVLLVFMFWVTVPLIVIGLFFGYNYMFIGPELGKDNVNKAMDSVAKAAQNLKKEVKGDKSNGEDSNN